MPTKIAGFVLRAKDKHKTAAFYRALGLSTRDHAHEGPMHYEVLPFAQDAVLEIYQRVSHPNSAIMLEVDSIEDSLEIAADFGIKPTTVLKEVGTLRFICIYDPDGQQVLLIEKLLFPIQDNKS